MELYGLPIISTDWCTSLPLLVSAFLAAIHTHQLMLAANIHNKYYQIEENERWFTSDARVFSVYICEQMINSKQTLSENNKNKFQICKINLEKSGAEIQLN